MLRVMVFLSFARQFSDQYGKKLRDTAKKTGMLQKLHLKE